MVKLNNGAIAAAIFQLRHTHSSYRFPFTMMLHLAVFTSLLSDISQRRRAKTTARRKLIGVLMPQWGMAVLFIGCCLLAGCRSDDITESREKPKPPIDPTELQVLKPGTYAQTLVLEDSSIVSFSISIPSSYDAATPIPLVVALHFGKGARYQPFFGNQMLRLMVMPAMRELEAIYLAPDMVGSTWTSEKNETNLIALLEKVFDKYNIDRQRVLLTGFSLGGAGTWYLAGRHQDTFTAALPMAGRPPAEAMETDWQIPLCVIHSADDEIVTVDKTRETVAALRQRGARVEYVELQGVSHFESDKFIEQLRASLIWLKRVWSMD